MMNTKSILDLCKKHCYPSIPPSDQIFGRALDLDQNTDINYDKLLNLAAIVEFREKNPAMFHSEKDQILLSDFDTMKGLCLSLYSDNIGMIEMFRALCRANLPKDLNWFHQCNAKDYQMFEFWKPQSKPATELAEKIARALDLPFLIALNKEYNVGEPIVLGKFNPIDIEDYYERANFYGS